MRFWLKGNVTIPPRPRTVGGLISWARGVNRALVELRDRKIEGKVPARSGSSHPWKVTANGDDTVTVGKGRLLTVRNASVTLSQHPSWVRLQQAASYDGGIIESISASGYIYGYTSKLELDTMFIGDYSPDAIQIDRTIPDTVITVAFSATLPQNTDGIGDEFCFVIAEVAFADGVAEVSEQILTHNPTMWHIDMPPGTL